MFQIVSGKFFGDGEINETEKQSILFSNYMTPENIEYHSEYVKVQATRCNNIITPYVVKYKNRYEKISEDDRMVFADDALVVEHVRLLTSFYFQAFFHEDRNHIELLTRQIPRHSNDRGVPSHFIPRYLDPTIQYDHSLTEGFEEYIGAVIGLNRTDYTLFISCLETFFDALESIPTNFDLGYSMFVYMLEALSQHLDNYEPTWDDFDQDVKVKLDEILENVEDSNKTKIINTLLQGKQLKLTKRFVDGIMEMVEDSFFEEESYQIERPIPKSDLKQALINLYKSRSQFVHSLQKIRDQLKVSQVVKNSDFFKWQSQPYLTISGLVRLSHHVLNSFLNGRQKVKNEKIEWRGDLPGILYFEVAPEYWIANTEGMKPSDSHKRFSGFYKFLTQNLQKSDFKFPLLKDLLIWIEKHFSNCNADHKKSLFSIYSTYSSMIVPDGKPDKADEFIKHHQELMTKECSLQMMVQHLFLKIKYPWNVIECAEIFSLYERQKYKKDGINLPTRLESALCLEIAKDFFDADNQEMRMIWSKKALLDSTGDKELQKRLRDSLDEDHPMSGFEILYPELKE
ncbi:hypothetical protein [Gimesia chilikensis]|uniref:hypothetical protein n=1 Tax=Gimesia chilikensis TaxID=2605989 RepID=UPI003A91C405